MLPKLHVLMIFLWTNFFHFTNMEVWIDGAKYEEVAIIMNKEEEGSV